MILLLIEMGSFGWGGGGVKIYGAVIEAICKRISNTMDICLMGLPKVGKTSIAKVIFQKMNPKFTLML